jgi:hypothetical protein
LLPRSETGFDKAALRWITMNNGRRSVMDLVKILGDQQHRGSPASRAAEQPRM